MKWLSLLSSFLLLSCLAWAQPDRATLQSDYQSEIVPLLEQYCFDCHDETEPEAEINFESFTSLDDIRSQIEIWLRVDEMLDSQQMPPKKAEQPTDRERTLLARWVREFLTAEARANAGDPGRVTLRRLSTAEYAYTIQDLTGIHSLDPVNEFPVDGAAGEGFTNTGESLVMSPSLVTKFLDAGKSVAAHAVLLPDGIRFSRHSSERDWTDEWLDRIRAFYARYTIDGGGSSVKLQGIDLPLGQDGLVPLERYFEALLVYRGGLLNGTTSITDVAKQRDVNSRYLALLWDSLEGNAANPSSLLIDRVRSLWRQSSSGDAAKLAAEVRSWQNALWKFNSIGHIGKSSGPKSWMEGRNPLTESRELRFRIPEPNDGKEVVVYLASNDAGEGREHDYVVWDDPRLVVEGEPAVRLRDVAGLVAQLAAFKKETLGKTSDYLRAAAVVRSSPNTDLTALATQEGLSRALLEHWLRYLDIGEGGAVEITGHYTDKMLKGGNYDFIQGWGSSETPSVLGNASDNEVRIPGISRPHSIVVHPSPTLFSAVAWKSPIDGELQVEARIRDAHPECGNGVAWRLQHRTPMRLENLWSGEFNEGRSASMPVKTVRVRQGQVITFFVRPRDQNHSCDLTEINFVLRERGGDQRVWDMAAELSRDLAESNPRADLLGNQDVWHVIKGPVTEMDSVTDGFDPVPAGSLLAHWKDATDGQQRLEFASRIRDLVAGARPKESPDAILYDQLQALPEGVGYEEVLQTVDQDPRFGVHPAGHPVDPAHLVVRAPSVTEFRVPARFAKGRELIATARMEGRSGRDGSAQVAVAANEKPQLQDLIPTEPILVTDHGRAQPQLVAAFDAFRDLFPLALCYTRIVPVDEVVTLTLFYREDDSLQRLMLNEAERGELNRLWDELLFLSQHPLKKLVALEQIYQFATQDRPDLVKEFEPMKGPMKERADAFRDRLQSTEPIHVRAVLDFAHRAWRRPLSELERTQLRTLYQDLRANDLDHDSAIRLLLARVLTSPAFLYRLEEPVPGAQPGPVSDLELASRLSYFLWSSQPDAELRELAEAGRLTDRGNLVAQTRRMLRDDRVRRLAIQFACQWLHIRDFDQNDGKNEKLYPEFASLRVDMYEETVRFFEDMFRNDGSILDLLSGDHTFLNESLAQHYGIPGVVGDWWRRVDGISANQRGGILAMATFLASQSGASRTSPILRGNWIYETLLGERLPNPPPTVPQLPESIPEGLTARQLIEQHSSVPECAKCHERIDPYGFALEAYDAIGRLRPQEVNTQTTVLTGQTIDGIDGLRDYLVTTRREDVIRQFCRKLLGYALGRAVKLSDQPLLDDLVKQLAANNYRFHDLVERVVLSEPFRNIRGEQMVNQ